MSGSEDWDRKEEMPVDERLKVLAAAAGEPKRKRPRPGDVAVGVAGGGRPAASGSASVEKEEPSSGAAAASRVRPESAAAATTAVAVEDTDALDCGVCFLPLKPPILQCARHAMTSSRPPPRHMLAVTPLVAISGATPWTAWWSPSVFHARMPPMAAMLGRPTMTSKATGRCVLMHLAPTRAVRTMASSVRRRQSWTISPA
ncbi:hypothetical protein GQ55_3G115300 [Panicum hallii var. hallii]|uniref:Uncharacterized protein n=1 Tax=Panicum hallii var. hallii TaxID=1504633 RepID=A0A2T7E8C7_9POAL|nr:hypothetical protein GQ55_3G115300 [Panicum hallii var. hallii]